MTIYLTDKSVPCLPALVPPPLALPSPSAGPGPLACGSSERPPPLPTITLSWASLPPPLLEFVRLHFPQVPFSGAYQGTFFDCFLLFSQYLPFPLLLSPFLSEPSSLSRFLCSSSSRSCFSAFFSCQRPCWGFVLRSLCLCSPLFSNDIPG